MTEVINTLYVIAIGADACAPIIGLKRRRASLERERDEAKATPELYAVYLDSLAKLDEGWQEFEMNALIFWQSINGATEVEATELVMLALGDAAAPYAVMGGDQGDSKKNMTRNG